MGEFIDYYFGRLTLGKRMQRREAFWLFIGAGVKTKGSRSRNARGVGPPVTSGLVQTE